MTAENLLCMALIILLLPLLSFTINIFWGKRLGKKPSFAIGTTALGIDFILSCVVFYNKVFGSIETVANTDGFFKIFANDTMVQAKFTWFHVGNGGIQLGLGVDNLAAIMLLVVTLISFLVHIFSSVYMHDDKRFPRFYAYLGIFTFSMLNIVLANNLLNMYIGWELVGICSYMLIGFWYEKDSAANAGKKAFLTNRVGDLGFLIGLLMLYYVFGNWMFDEVFPSMNSQDLLAALASGEKTLPLGMNYGTYLTLAGCFIFCGAIGKSAQFPLHVWLPDAMEGPTPVSALIHAATMVAAGVYLTARIYPMMTATTMNFVAFIGAMTAFMAATIAITQRDFKKVLAYSTVSQLGYMVMALGVGAFTSGFFHLVTHAWFKAALFLASGSVIHAMHMSMHHAGEHHMDPQDINNMGGLRNNMKITYITFLFVTLAISGVPLTSGFLSKDSILAGTLAFADLAGGLGWLVPIAGFGAAGITAFYMFRLTIVAFHGKPKTEIAKNTKENSFSVVMPLVVLATLSLWFFYSFNPIDANAGWFYEKVKMPASTIPAEYQRPYMLPLQQVEAAPAEMQNGHEQHHALTEYEETMHHFHVPAMILSLLIAGLGIAFAFCVYQFRVFNADNMEKQFKKLHTFSFHKWYFDELYDATVIGFTLFLTKVFSNFDSKVVDGLVNASAWITSRIGKISGIFDGVVIDGAVNLVANTTGALGGITRKLQTGKIQTVIIFAIIGLITLIYVFA